MGNETQINPQINEASTQLNPAFANHATVINSAVAADHGDSLVGTTLAGKYEIVERMDVSTGEADIYICQYGDRRYAAKIYRREAAIKPSILEALKTVRSPFVARTFEVGTHNGKPFEILAYYGEGSLRGQKCSFEELKKTIIPDINEALKVLHQHNIIHKDVKPSNIMRWNDRDGVALIDFGISSVMENGNTMVVTSTGMTPEYSAPETFRGLFLDESDYYSFGITLYELFCGCTPYQNMTADQIARYTAVQKIPFPPTMPKQLQELITGLTYVDITHRNEKDNPNKRWTYQEVLNWCMGKKQPLPGAGVKSAASMPAYTFMGERYSDIASLVDALAAHWDNGKRQLFRGLMSGFFTRIDPEIAGHCMDAEDAANHPDADEDKIFWKLLYRLDPSLRAFVWAGHRYETLDHLGRDMLYKLRNDDTSDESFWDNILQLEILSYYVEKICSGEPGVVRALKTIEEAQQRHSANPLAARRNYYTLGYLLSGDRTLETDGRSFAAPDDLIRHMKNLMEDSYETFAAFCDRLIAQDGTLEPQFEVWLTALGKRAALSDFKQKLAG